MKQALLVCIVLTLTACAASTKKEDSVTAVKPNTAKCSSEKETITCVWDEVRQR